MSCAAQLAMFTDAEETIAQKVSMAMKSDLSPVERAVLICLWPRAKGKLYMMSTDFMQASWQNDGAKVHERRSVRAAVKTLLESYGIPIGSSRTPGENGYWLILTDEEAEDASRHLRNEIMSLFRRLKVISPKSAFVRQLQGQLDLLKEEQP